MRTAAAIPWKSLDWDAALQDLDARYRSGGGAEERRSLADAASLSALFAPSFGPAWARVALANQLEPLNPLHRVREALLLMRFGQWKPALDLLHELEELLPDHPLILYLEALGNLRDGDINKAKNLVAKLLDSYKHRGTDPRRHPTFFLGRFLEAEIKARVRTKGIESVLIDLPSDPRYAAAWCDLLCKLAVDSPRETTKLVDRYAGKALPRGMREAALVEQVVALNRAFGRGFDGASGAAAVTGPSLEDAEKAVTSRPAGSRAEELALVLLYDALGDETGAFSALRALRSLHERLPDRASVRRVFAASLTRFAVGAAGKNELETALRAVEVCRRLEPHETVHRLNRAAILTLLRDAEASHEAWADVDRHNYRLALLGRLDPLHARATARVHRMFAQQARLTPEEADRTKPRLNLGIFRESASDRGGVTEIEVDVNQERIEVDPEQLRQWIHHRAAEMTFSHLALGFDPQRFLLAPSDRRSSRARREALGLLARSLAVLVPEEGSQLADHLRQTWTEREASFLVSYQRPEPPGTGSSTVVERTKPEPANEDVKSVSRAHLETFADLNLLCHQWEPMDGRVDLLDELLEILEAEAPFFDLDILAEALADRHVPPPQPIRLLGIIVRETLNFEADDPWPALTEEGRDRIVARMKAQVLVRGAWRCAQEQGKSMACARALKLIDRARAAGSDLPDVEYAAARFLAAEEYWGAAADSVAKCRRLIGGREHRLSKPVEDLEQIIAKARSAGDKGGSRPPVEDPEPSGRQGSGRIEELENQLASLPSAIAIHEELAALLAGQGHFPDALACCERAIARCLERAAQLRARAVHIEILGLQILAPGHAPAVRHYLEGANGPLLSAIEALAPKERPYPVLYVFGRCLLAARRREEAQEAFTSALASCQRQLHLPVLRRLSKDVELDILEQAHREIESALADARYQAASELAAAAFEDLHAPAAVLIELARIQFAAAVARLDPPALPETPVRLTWAVQVRAVEEIPDGLERAKRLAELASGLHEPSGPEAIALVGKIEAFQKQMRMAQAFTESANLMRVGKWQEALSTLDAEGQTKDEPRFERQRALLLLRLERFSESEQVAARLRESASTVAREFIERYPFLRCQHQLAAVTRLLRSGDRAGASALLGQVVPADEAQELEVAYCRSYVLAQQAYGLYDAGQKSEAMEIFTEALTLVEGKMVVAQRLGHDRLVELRARLEKDLDDLKVPS